MSELDKMIKELCPEGVERIPFLECATFTRGITYNKSQEANQGQDSYKVLRANNITLGLNSLNFDDVKEVVHDVKVKPEQWLKKDDILICAGSGSKEHVGKVAYINRDIDYCFGGFMGVIRPKDGVSNRYLFHCLVGNTFSEYLKSALNSTTINNLNNQVMSGYEIPLPPLSIQQKIVSVLDSFTTLIDKMKQEVEKRKKQMEYYREKLLTFKDGKCEWNTLGECCNTISSGKCAQKLEEGLYPVYGSTGIIAYTDTYRYSEDKILIARVGANAGYVHIASGYYDVTDNTLIVDLKKDKNLKFVYYHLINRGLNQYAKGGGQPLITGKDVKELNFPFPSLTKQSEIVSTLDKFESYITKLEKMIELRQKQYEYYREQLLTFE